MSDDEQKEFLRTVSLAQAALRAATEREEKSRSQEIDRDEGSMQHLRFKEGG